MFQISRGRASMLTKLRSSECSIEPHHIASESPGPFQPRFSCSAKRSVAASSPCAKLALLIFNLGRLTAAHEIRPPEQTGVDTPSQGGRRRMRPAHPPFCSWGRLDRDASTRDGPAARGLAGPLASLCEACRECFAISGWRRACYRVPRPARRWRIDIDAAGTSP